MAKLNNIESICQFGRALTRETEVQSQVASYQRLKKNGT